MFLLNGIVHTMAGKVISPGYVAFDAGKISAVGTMASLSLPASARYLDVSGCHITPGLVDAHSHLGLFGDGTADADANESAGSVMPRLRVIDAINPFDRGFEEARRAGITAVLISPGSANFIGGQIAALKTAGRCVDDMLLKSPAAIKFSLGENPKGQKGGPRTRMGSAARIREALEKAQAYAEQLERKKSPEPDLCSEALLPLLRGQIPAHFHVHRADDIATAIRISEEFGLSYVLIHCTEGWKITDLLAEKKARVIVGPMINDRSRAELAGARADNPAVLKRAGLLTAVCTDHPENPEQYLALCAALAAREGIESEQALAMITRDAAAIAGISDRVGTLRAGLDADIAVFRGHPLEVSSRAEAVFIDGERVV